MRRRRSPGRAIAPLLVGLAGTALLGCTSTAYQLQPYRDQPELAAALSEAARQECAAQRGDTELPPYYFTSDGCSLWPDSTWVECCVVHDMAYWCGGSADDRERADQALRDCVVRSGPQGMGTAMYLGVRAGGPPWFPVPFRWAYGWDWPHGYE